MPGPATRWVSQARTLPCRSRTSLGRTTFHERRLPTRSIVAAPRATWVTAITRLSTRAKMLLRHPDPSGPRLSPEARLLEIEVPLDAAHHFRADLALIAQGQDGFPLGRKQFAPPAAPRRGACRVLLGRPASFKTRHVALDAPLVVLTHPLLTLR